MAPRPLTAVNTDYIAPIKATVVEAVKELIEEMYRKLVHGFQGTNQKVLQTVLK